jgi:uncharacterized protein YhdP
VSTVWQGFGPDFGTVLTVVVAEFCFEDASLFCRWQQEKGKSRFLASLGMTGRWPSTGMGWRRVLRQALRVKIRDPQRRRKAGAGSRQRRASVSEGRRDRAQDKNKAARLKAAATRTTAIERKAEIEFDCRLRAEVIDTLAG